MHKGFVYFFLLATCSFLNCFSMPIDFNEASTIQKCVDNKVYLQPGHVQIANNGIFINIEGDLVPVDHLEMDAEGVYFEPQRMRLEYCDTCGLPTIWEKCVNPLCPSKKKKKSKKQKE